MPAVVSQCMSFASRSEVMASSVPHYPLLPPPHPFPTAQLREAVVLLLEITSLQSCL